MFSALSLLEAYPGIRNWLSCSHRLELSSVGVSVLDSVELITAEKVLRPLKGTKQTDVQLV